MKISFLRVDDLMHVRSELDPIIKRNKEKLGVEEVYKQSISTFLEAIVDMREYDVPYYIRVAIDKGSAEK